MSKHMNTDVQVRKIPNSRLWEIKAAQKQIRDILKSKTANVKCGKDTHIFYVEAPHRFQGCYRCGQDGHTSYECTAKDDEIRCVKCSGEHPWALCESERELCLFCAQPHMGMRCPLKKGGEPIEKQRVRTVPRQAPASRAAAPKIADANGAKNPTSKKNAWNSNRAASPPPAARPKPGKSLLLEALANIRRQLDDLTKAIEALPDEIDTSTRDEEAHRRVGVPHAEPVLQSARNEPTRIHTHALIGDSWDEDEGNAPHGHHVPPALMSPPDSPVPHSWERAASTPPHQAMHALATSNRFSPLEVDTLSPPTQPESYTNPCDSHPNEVEHEAVRSMTAPQPELTPRSEAPPRCTFDCTATRPTRKRSRSSPPKGGIPGGVNTTTPETTARLRLSIGSNPVTGPDVQGHKGDGK